MSLINFFKYILTKEEKISIYKNSIEYLKVDNSLGFHLSMCKALLFHLELLYLRKGIRASTLNVIDCFMEQLPEFQQLKPPGRFRHIYFFHTKDLESRISYLQKCIELTTNN